MGHSPVVQLLLDAQAAVHAADTQGSTALHLAAVEGHPAVVQLLLNAQAPVDAAAADGSTALICAARMGHSEVHLHVMQLLLDAQADVNSAAVSRATPLSLAAAAGCMQAVQLLLAAPQLKLSAVEQPLKVRLWQVQSGQQCQQAMQMLPWWR
jgi:ankyrin repeat protein